MCLIYKINCSISNQYLQRSKLQFPGDVSKQFPMTLKSSCMTGKHGVMNKSKEEKDDFFFFETSTGGGYGSEQYDW